MRWTIFPTILVVLGFSVKHLWGQRRNRDVAVKRISDPPYSRVAGRTAIVGFGASVGLALFGLVLGACIRSSTTLVPAHYHASLGAVTVAFMAAAYFVCDRVRRGDERNPLSDQVWRLAKWQLALFGIGQTVFVLGFAIGGAYGLGRKAYAAEQHVRSTGEITGLIVMGVGGLVAVAGGLWFLFLVLREIRAWWRPCATRPAKFVLSTTP
jgi:heme/copper-type cytochrome/quinol oxidase subunit 1